MRTGLGCIDQGSSIGRIEFERFDTGELGRVVIAAGQVRGRNVVATVQEALPKLRAEDEDDDTALE
jgi:hypothetical protein